jgi:hypothetical protein
MICFFNWPNTRAQPPEPIDTAGEQQRDEHRLSGAKN